MSRKMSRRKLIAGASAGALAVAGIKAALPPKYGTVYGMGDAVTYHAFKAMLRNQPLAREFPRDAVTKNFPVLGSDNPRHPEFQRFHAHNFADWKLAVEGLVERPAAFSLADLRAMPARTQVTQHSCEEGWSAIAEWTGVQLSHVLEAAGMLPQARYVFFLTYEDDWWDSLDLLDALHPQTLLAYGMNGADVPVAHGAPVRLRVERQLGYKSLKFLRRVIVTDRQDEIRDGTGSASVSAGYAWYAGI